MKTGGVHAAAIWTRDGVLVAIAEDVGRHNAVDKAIGMAMIVKTDLSQCFLTLTGRLTEDIVLKSSHGEYANRRFARCCYRLRN